MNSARLGSLPALILAALIIPACDNNPKPLQIPVSRGETVLRAAALSGRQQVPPVATSASGNATVSVNATRTEASVVLTVEGLANITMAHIHVGDLGVNGPIIFTLAEGSFSSPLILTISSATLTARPELGIQTFDQAVSMMVSGRTYVNVHSVANPDGEIRGQLGPAQFGASLDGAHETPPVASGATGTLSLTLNADQTQMSFIMSMTGMQNITEAHFHVAPVGVPGPIIFPLPPGPFAAPLSGILTSANFTPQPEAGVATFEQAVDAILSGNAFVNVHSVEHPNGEIRGQILPLNQLPGPGTTPASVPPASTTPITPGTGVTTGSGTTTGPGPIVIPLYSSRPNSRNQ